MEKVPWHQSLYGRALLFIVLGAGLLIVGGFFHIESVVEQFVRQVLQERLETARVAAAFLDEHILTDSEPVRVAARRCLPARCPTSDSSTAEEMARIIKREEHIGATFVLDGGGEVLVVVPADLLHAVAGLLQSGKLFAEARQRRGAVASQMHFHLFPNDTAVMVLDPLLDRDGAILGASGIVMPGSKALRSGISASSSTAVELIDRAGSVVASSKPWRGVRLDDHDDVLSSAIRDRRTAQLRCHSCHQDRGNPESRQVDLLAFAPLPRLDMGIAVAQLETEATAPVVRTQRRLFFWVAAFVCAYVLLSTLSVRLVVGPVMQLVRTIQGSQAAEPRLHKFGAGEVGLLARTLARWQSELTAALSVAQQRGQEVREAALASGRLLAALHDITELSLRAESQEHILQHGLDALQPIVSYDFGVLSLAHHDQRWLARHQMADEAALRLLGEASQCFSQQSRGDPGQRKPGVVDAKKLATGLRMVNDGPMLFVEVPASHGLKLTGCLQLASEVLVDAERVEALLHHVVVSASYRLLREEQTRRHNQRRDLLRRVLRAEEEERSRLARELHDTLSQDLAAVRLHLERLCGLGLPEQVTARLESLEAETRRLLEAVRRMTLDLRPLVVKQMGLVEAVRWHVERLEEEHGISARLSVDGVEGDLADETALNLFRICQEALQNVIQHAEAAHVMVALCFCSNAVSLTVEDDGVGFLPERLKGSREPTSRQAEQMSGLGLLGIEERAKLLGGTIAVDTSPGQGTVLRVIVPPQGPVEAWRQEE